ncbi:hypothetical protein BJ944DRAFT_228597 [Cunninghamella echinulata]|nr:hypothetical protein BJ944DRAFT_228597 [Cunninghamella echinulata]
MVSKRGGRGGSRGKGSRGRGRGRGGHGGGGRGRNRTLQPTGVGYIYPLTDSAYDLDDEMDFKLFGQFDDDSEDSEIEFNSKHSKRKAKVKKQQLNRTQRNESNESNTATTSIASTSIVTTNKNQITKTKDRKGKYKPKKSQFTDISDTSKHFIRSTNVLNDPTQLSKEKKINVSNEDKDDYEHEDGEERDIDLNNLHDEVGDLDIDEEVFNQLTQKTALFEAKLSQASSLTAAVSTTSTSITSAIANNSKSKNDKLIESMTSNNDTLMNKGNRSINKKGKINGKGKNKIVDGDLHYQLSTSSTSLTESNDDDDGFEFEISESELDYDTDVMQDYIDNGSLKDEDIQRILSRNPDHFYIDETSPTEEEDDDFDEGMDNELTKNQQQILHQLLTTYDGDEDEELRALEDKFLMDLLLNEDHEDDDDDEDDEEIDDDAILNEEERFFLNGNDYDGIAEDEISPDMFRITLEEALAEVPPGLKPGVRNWLSHEKKEQKKQKRLEKKERRKEAKEKNQKSKNNNKDIGPAVQLRKVDSRLQDFIMDSQIQSLQFAPMPKNSRRQLHLLATAYNLKSHSVGSGKSRMPIVTKTDRTFLPQDRRYIERYIEEAQSSINAQDHILRKHRMDSNNQGGRRRNNKNATPTSSSSKKKDKKKEKYQKSADKNQNNDTPPLGKNLHGTVVASNAAPIHESNVGHRMLAAMGWQQGSGLGSTSTGITAPIEAVIRGNRRGLGT